MKILMVTPYPPIRDGIASYAVQAVKGLRAEGHDVEVLSPGPSAAHHHLDLVGPRGALALAKRVGHYDKLIVQFHPDFFYPVPSTARDRAAVSLALLAAFRRAGEVEVVVHEIDYRHGRVSVDGMANRLLWSSVDRIVVHTENERRTFARAFGVSPQKISLTEHGVRFLPRTFYDRARARASLGIPQDACTFLSIGFIQPHKGFDRAVNAFAGLGARGCRLDIVGSVRVDDPGYVAYSNELSVLARATDGVSLHDGYVSDELFDRWIVASDVVVLPYRSIWSSGVLERAALYGRPIIATAVGGLPEQAAAGRDVTLVADDAELRTAMWSVAGQRTVNFPSTPWPVEGLDLRGSIQQEVRLRAATDRGSRVTAGAARTTGTDTESLLGASAVSAPVRRVHQLQLPPTNSHRASAAFVKRMVRRLTAWEVEPVVGQVNALRAATVEALEELAVRRSADRSDPGGTAPGDRAPSDDDVPTATPAD